MKLLVLGSSALRAALPMPRAIAAMQQAFADFSLGRAILPPRLHLPVPPAGGTVLFMPARVGDWALGAKIVSVFPRNTERGRPAISGLVALLDPASGEPTALCDGAFLTAWRTGAASGTATNLLARPDARVAAVFGSGAQARTQIMAIDCVRRLEIIRVYARRRARLVHFVEAVQPEVGARLVAAGTPREAVDAADIVCTATDSPTPVLDGLLVSEGAHVNAIGSFTPTMRELDQALIRRARVFVDSRAAARAEAGELIEALAQSNTSEEAWTEIGLLAAGQAPGRQAEEEITLFKSVGLAVQDVTAAALAVEEARRMGLGALVEV